MLKKKSIDYIFGMITGASLMLAFWACTTPLDASGATIQEVRVVNESLNARTNNTMELK
ncbi:MAG: ABC transporter ATP-binding protein [Candidatus Marinimicrobia bacterium]|nr:ABC transporter ATP-binding protein [Candidatus Neomarinimicrobiota bacterium]